MSKISSNCHVNSTILLMTKTISRKIRQFYKYEKVRQIVTSISCETFLSDFKHFDKDTKRSKNFFGSNLSLLSCLVADSWLKGTKGKFPEGEIFYFSSEMFAVYLSRKKLPNLFTPKGMISDSSLLKPSAILCVTHQRKMNLNAFCMQKA